MYEYTKLIYDLRPRYTNCRSHDGDNSAHGPQRQSRPGSSKERMKESSRQARRRYYVITFDVCSIADWSWCRLEYNTKERESQAYRGGTSDRRV